MLSATTIYMKNHPLSMYESLPHIYHLFFILYMKKILEKREHLIIRSEEQLECILLAIKKRHHKVFSNCQFLHVPVLKNLSSGKSYHHFYIPKKNGGKRHISSPFKELKYVQLGLAIMFNSIYRPHENAFGFINNKSIVDNAQKHINKDIIVNIDLKDFFESINYDTLIEKFIRQPYYFSYRIALLLADVLTANVDDKRFLPQGAPSSPILTNMIAYYLDVRLSKFCEKHNITYTRYADDITFSFDNQSYIYWNGKRGVGYKDTIMKIINSEGFEINNRKTRISFKNQRQEVTGLVVNKKVNVKKEYIKHLRCEIHNWEYDGYVIASYKFLKNYERLHGTSKKIAPMENVIDGKLSFIKMVKGKDDSTYIKLKNRYDRLLIRDRAFLEIAQNYPELGNKDAVEARIKELEELISEVQTPEKDERIKETSSREITISEDDFNGDVLTGETETEYYIEDAINKRATPRDTALVRQLRELGVFDFITRGSLAYIAEDYTDDNPGEELPINYLLYKGNTYPELKGKVVLAVDVTQYEDKATYIHIGDKKYQIVGIVGTSSTDRATIAKKKEYIGSLYNELVEEDAQKINNGSNSSNPEWFVSDNFHTSLAHINIGRMVLSGETVNSKGETVIKSEKQEQDLLDIPGIIKALNNNDCRFGVLLQNSHGNVDFGNPNFQNPNTGAAPGTVYLMVKAADGKYYPRGIRIKSVAEVLKNYSDAEEAETNPYLKKVLENLVKFTKSSLTSTRLEAKDDIIKNYIYLPEDVKLTFDDRVDDKNNIITAIQLRIGEGSPIITLWKGEQEEVTEEIAFEVLQKLVTNANTNGKPLRFQINKDRIISEEDYAEDIVRSGIGTTNLMQIRNIVPNFLIRKTDISTGQPIAPEKTSATTPPSPTPQKVTPTYTTTDIKVGDDTYTKSVSNQDGSVKYYVNGKEPNDIQREIIRIIFGGSANVPEAAPEQDYINPEEGDDFIFDDVDDSNDTPPGSSGDSPNAFVTTPRPETSMFNGILTIVENVEIYTDDGNMSQWIAKRRGDLANSIVESLKTLYPKYDFNTTDALPTLIAQLNEKFSDTQNGYTFIEKILRKAYELGAKEITPAVIEAARKGCE